MMPALLPLKTILPGLLLVVLACGADIPGWAVVSTFILDQTATSAWTALSPYRKPLSGTLLLKLMSGLCPSDGWQQLEPGL